MPPKLLETFGETSVNYLVLSEDMDFSDKIRLRRVWSVPRVHASSRRKYFLKQAVSNFGEDAKVLF